MTFFFGQPSQVLGADGRRRLVVWLASTDKHQNEEVNPDEATYSSHVYWALA